MRVCTVCGDKSRKAIEKALVEGGSYRDIAGRYGVSKSAVERHAKRCVPERLARAAEVRERVNGDALLGRLEELRSETLAVLESVRGRDDAVALKAIQRLEKQLELAGRLIGELRDGSTVNVLVSPEWVALRTVILGVLERHPEARRDVSAALEEAGGLADAR